MARPRLGIDVGGTKLLVLAQWPERRIVERAPTGAGFTGRDLDDVLARFVEGLETAPEAAGVAVPGLVGPDGAVLASDVLPGLVGWQARELARICPARILNDVEAAALEELLELPGYLEAARQAAERQSLPELWRACEVRRVRQGELTAALGALRASTAELV